jgi:hypothetical protein
MSHLLPAPLTGRRRSLLPGLLAAAVAASLALTPAGADAATHRKTSHPSAAAKKRAKAKKRRVTNSLARAAQSAVTTGPLLHTRGLPHYKGGGDSAILDEDWREFSDVPRWHIRTTMTPASASFESWDETTVNAGVMGVLDTPLAARLDPSHDIYCPNLPGGTADHPWTWPEWNVVLVEQARAARTQVEAIDAIRRDPAARAALPAGPIVHDRPTVVATVDAPLSSRGYRDVAPQIVVYDAASGDVVRTVDPGGYGYTEYSLWELIPAGGDASNVALPDEIARQAHCRQ